MVHIKTHLLEFVGVCVVLVHVPSPLEVCVVADCGCTEAEAASTSDSRTKMTASPLTLIRHCACGVRATPVEMNKHDWLSVWTSLCVCLCMY